MASDTLGHLQAHHGDFADFRVLMEQSHAGRFDQIFWSVLSLAVDALPAELQRAPRFLDAGSGPGLLATDLCEKYSLAEVIALEIQPEMLKAARERFEGLSRIRLIEQDLAKPWTDMADQSVDVVIASMLVHELQVPTLFIREASRVLRPGGQLVIYDWVRQPLCDYTKGRLPETEWEVNHFSEHCRYTPEDIAWMCESSGLRPDEWMVRHNGRHFLGRFVR